MSLEALAAKQPDVAGMPPEHPVEHLDGQPATEASPRALLGSLNIA